MSAMSVGDSHWQPSRASRSRHRRGARL